MIEILMFITFCHCILGNNIQSRCDFIPFQVIFLWDIFYVFHRDFA